MVSDHQSVIDGMFFTCRNSFALKIEMKFSIIVSPAHCWGLYRQQMTIDTLQTDTAVRTFWAYLSRTDGDLLWSTFRRRRTRSLFPCHATCLPAGASVSPWWCIVFAFCCCRKACL